MRIASPACQARGKEFFGLQRGEDDILFDNGWGRDPADGQGCARRGFDEDRDKLLVKVLLRSRRLMNYLARLKMNASSQERWGINNLMYITKTQTPMDATDILLQFNEHNLHSELVRQDVLILTGAEDHFIPLKMHYKQENALRHAKSVTGRIFTKEDQAQNHCQIGNIGLALDVMEKWMEEKTGM